MLKVLLGTTGPPKGGLDTMLCSLLTLLTAGGTDVDEVRKTVQEGHVGADVTAELRLDRLGWVESGNPTHGIPELSELCVQEAVVTGLARPGDSKQRSEPGTLLVDALDPRVELVDPKIPLSVPTSGHSQSEHDQRETGDS